MADRIFMKLAINVALQGVEAGQTPFGACIVRDGEVIACEHNVVWQTTDITAHAEVHAIRAACRKLTSISLDGATIYSTTEPCPMCFSACHWARIGRIVFGARIEDAARFGFHELGVSNSRLRELGQSPVEIVEGFMKEECLAVFEAWASKPGKRAY